MNAQVDFWEPVTPGEKWLKVPSWDVVGRMRGGITTNQAQSELAVIAGREARADKEFDGFAPGRCSRSPAS